MWPFTNGKWLDHQCRKPIFIDSKRIGERWLCSCGRVWVIATINRIYYSDGTYMRKWRLVGDEGKSA